MTSEESSLSSEIEDGPHFSGQGFSGAYDSVDGSVDDEEPPTVPHIPDTQTRAHIPSPRNPGSWRSPPRSDWDDNEDLSPPFSPLRTPAVPELSPDSTLPERRSSGGEDSPRFSPGLFGPSPLAQSRYWPLSPPRSSPGPFTPSPWNPAVIGSPSPLFSPDQHVPSTPNHPNLRSPESFMPSPARLSPQYTASPNSRSPDSPTYSPSYASPGSASYRSPVFSPRYSPGSSPSYSPGPYEPEQRAVSPGDGSPSSPAYEPAL